MVLPTRHVESQRTARANGMLQDCQRISPHGEMLTCISPSSYSPSITKSKANMPLLLEAYRTWQGLGMNMGSKKQPMLLNAFLLWKLHSL